MYKKIKEKGGRETGMLSPTPFRKRGGGAGRSSGGSQTNQFMALPERSLENADAGRSVCCAC